MAPAQSTGGWGTIEEHRIRVLVLAPAERIATAQAIVRSLTPRHEVTLHAPEKVGFTARVATAQLATTFRPHLIHQVGVDGVARSAGSVARGIGVPLVVSVDDDDRVLLSDLC